MLHLMKLAVGVRDIGHLRALQDARARLHPPLRHQTRNFPRRAGELTQGGSLYWVIGGLMRARQLIVDVIEDRRPDGSACAGIVLHPEVLPVEGRLLKPFQGWRYLAAGDAPPDLASGATADTADMSVQMQHDLRRLGLL